MILTNGSWATRELYDNNSATTINCVPATAPGTRLVMGVLHIKMRVRFAGLHDPAIANPRSQYISQHVMKGQMERSTPTVASGRSSVVVQPEIV